MPRKRKGILLAGGNGTRLYPATQVISKQLLPVYDKPMVYYPLCTLMSAGIQDILLISTPRDIGRYEQLFGDGSKWGISITYAVQPQPDGLAQAFIVGKDFVEGHPSALILGDNIFYGEGLQDLLLRADKRTTSTIFAYHVQDPQRYGIVSFDAHGHAKTLEEKPALPKSSYAVTGLYFYDQHARDYVKEIKPSARGELEITDLNRIYLERDELAVEVMGRGYAWLDTGTHTSLLDASRFVQTIEARQGLKIACPEEIAFHNHWISAEDLEKRAAFFSKSSYGDYLHSLLPHVATGSRA